MKHLPLIALLLAGCGASENAAVDKAIDRGKLFCLRSTAAGPAIVALANVAGAPVTATSKATDIHALACAALGAVPTGTPSNPDAVPVVPVPVVPAR